MTLSIVRIPANKQYVHICNKNFKILFIKNTQSTIVHFKIKKNNLSLSWQFTRPVIGQDATRYAWHLLGVTIMITLVNY